jgi:hypothetical protein
MLKLRFAGGRPSMKADAKLFTEMVNREKKLTTGRHLQVVDKELYINKLWWYVIPSQESKILNDDEEFSKESGLII